MLIFIITVGVYLVSLLDVHSHQSVISMDDGRLMMYLSEHKLKISDIFRPGWQGKYYRPFVDLSFYVDQKIWNDIPAGFRLTNLLLHAFNSILLFLTVRTLLKDERWSSGAAFFSAILFAIHPAAVESVAWISGRTDPLATLFSLLTFLSYLLFKKSGNRPFLAISAFCCIAAILSKEVAIAMPVLIAAWELLYCNSFGYKRGRHSIKIIAALSAFLPLYLGFRALVMSGSDLGLGLIKRGLLGNDIFFTSRLFFASFGFYLKKFFYPFPLNFTIYEINASLYAAIGLIAVVTLLISVFYKKRLRYHFFFFWAMLGLGPAALISFTSVAWTPWAERYLYFSIAPLSAVTVMAVFLLIKNMKQRPRLFQAIPLLVPLLFFAVSSCQRSVMMNNNMLIWQDSYEKSPGFMGAAIEYANSLISEKRLDDAEKVLLKAKHLHGARHLLFLNLGHISVKRGDYVSAEGYYRKALEEARKDENLVSVGPTFRQEILSYIAEIELEKAAMADDYVEKRAYYLQAIESLLSANQESSNPFIFYRVAKLYLEIDEENNAAEYLTRFIRLWKDDHYRKAAVSILNRLEPRELKGT